MRYSALNSFNQTQSYTYAILKHRDLVRPARNRQLMGDYYRRLRFLTCLRVATQLVYCLENVVLRVGIQMGRRLVE